MGHSHPPSQWCFVLNRNGFSLIGLIKKDFSAASYCLVHPQDQFLATPLSLMIKFIDIYITFIINYCKNVKPVKLLLH